ncbi:biotin synthase [Lebetimonas sp. JS032]|uniref:biotin synthase n=1 Tax=Lebetimonas sp. JS032 TaxID=990070 RepID=UPI00046469F8|nr:biotin synthase [Lebetimonas sp. JS032]
MDKVYLCAISNIRSGACREDCRFCTQSVKWGANINRYREKSIKTIVYEAKLAKKNRASGFCLVTSGKGLDDKTLEYVGRASKAILKEVDITIIACNGIASKVALKELKNCGVKIYNHNLETSQEYYPKICSTHSWDERFKTCENIKSVGLGLCCGGIFGMGESEEDRISLINSLKKLNPEGIPINFFIENKKLPLKATHTKEFAIDMIKKIRKEFPNSIVMMAGGREVVFKETWIEGIKAGANSIVIGDYLTTKGEKPDKDIEILKKENIEIANAC